MKTFADLLVALVRAEVKFILVGGLAVELAGFTRSTLDVDIVVDDDSGNLRRLLNLLSNFGEGSARELTEADFTPEEGCIRVIEEFPVDIFTRMGGRTYQDLLPFACLHPLDGVLLSYLGAKGLILLKENSPRPKDQVDVIELKRLT